MRPFNNMYAHIYIIFLYFYFLSCAMRTTSGGGAPSFLLVPQADICSCTQSGTTVPSSLSRASSLLCCISPTWRWRPSRSLCSLVPSASSPACGLCARSMELSRLIKQSSSTLNEVLLAFVASVVLWEGDFLSLS